MICTNCFKAEYRTGKTGLMVTVDGESHVLRDLDCETCPACGEITFTHAPSLEIDKKRIALEFGLKPLLTPDQLENLRRVLDMTLAEIREIRASERKFYQKITDIYATAMDYSADAETTKAFFAAVQNKLHFAIHGHTAAELISKRADSSKDHMGLTTWKNAPDGKILKPDVVVA